MRILHLLTLSAVVALSANLPAQEAHHLTGWKSNPHHAAKLKQFVHHPEFAATIVPDRVDISGEMPRVYDQGNEGSCVANSAVAAFEHQWKIQHNAFAGLSRQGLYRDLLIHDGNYPQDAGSYTSSALWVFSNKGVGLESSYPYVVGSWTKTPSKVYTTQAATYKSVTAYDVDSTDHISIMKALAKDKPVMFGGYVYAAIESLTKTNYFNPPPKGKPIGGHERVIVGYDRKLTHVFSGKTYTGFYWVRNSWGPDWGSNGHSWEPMSVIEDPRINEDFAVIDTVK